MKKMVLGCLLAIGMISGLYADSAADEQFKQYVNLTKNSPENPKGMTVCADNTYRIIYISMPIPLSSSDATPAVISKMKSGMLAEMGKLKEDVKIVKDLKINFVYSFIATDKRVFCIAVSYKDF